jgi:hypothetical protein
MLSAPFLAFFCEKWGFWLEVTMSPVFNWGLADRISFQQRSASPPILTARKADISLAI